MSTIKELANDPHDANPWLLFIELGIPTVPTLYLVCNNEPIAWKGNEYKDIGIEPPEIQTGKGQTPSIQMALPNAASIITKYLEQYYSYLIDNGAEGNEIDVKLSVVPYKLILEDSDCEAATAIRVQYINGDIDNKNAVLTVGADNIMNRQFPNLTIGMTCNWEFKDSVCGYSGAETKCNRTLQRCRVLGNSARFGGHPGVMPLGVQIATS